MDGGRLALKASTRVSYEHHIALYLKPGLGHVRLADLCDTDFEELYGAMRQIGRTGQGKPSPMLARLLVVRTETKQARPLTPNRVRIVHATVRSALNAAVKRRKIAHNRRSTSSWNGSARRGPWSGPMSGRPVAAHRPAPVTGDGVDADTDRHVPRLRGRRPSLRAVGTCSSSAGRHRKAQQEARLSWGPGWTETGLVFTHEDGRALSPNGVSQRFDRLVTRHDMPSIRLHDLRHVAATLR